MFHLPSLQCRVVLYGMAPYNATREGPQKDLVKTSPAPTIMYTSNPKPSTTSQKGAGLVYQRPKKLLDQIREAIRLKHYSIRTEEAYVSWIKRYILFHNKQHPREMGVPEIEAFLTHLAVGQNVSVSTQGTKGSGLHFWCYYASATLLAMTLTVE